MNQTVTTKTLRYTTTNKRPSKVGQWVVDTYGDIGEVKSFDLPLSYASDNFHGYTSLEMVKNATVKEYRKSKAEGNTTPLQPVVLNAYNPYTSTDLYDYVNSVKVINVKEPTKAEILETFGYVLNLKSYAGKRKGFYDGKGKFISLTSLQEKYKKELWQ